LLCKKVSELCSRFLTTVWRPEHERHRRRNPTKRRNVTFSRNVDIVFPSSLLNSHGEVGFLSANKYEQPVRRLRIAAARSSATGHRDEAHEMPGFVDVAQLQPISSRPLEKVTQRSLLRNCPKNDLSGGHAINSR
jgi:hypothetical protein